MKHFDAAYEDMKGETFYERQRIAPKVGVFRGALPLFRQVLQTSKG